VGAGLRRYRDARFLVPLPPLLRFSRAVLAKTRGGRRNIFAMHIGTHQFAQVRDVRICLMREPRQIVRFSKLRPLGGATSDDIVER